MSNHADKRQMRLKERIDKRCQVTQQMKEWEQTFNRIAPYIASRFKRKSA